MHNLTIVSGPEAGRSITLERDVVIGRRGSDLPVPDEGVSRLHAVVRLAGAGAVIEDLGSTNGTFVDGKQITHPVTVMTDVSIQVGDTELRLELLVATATRISQRPDAPAEDAPAQGAPAVEAAPEPRRPARRGLLLVGGVLVLAAAAVVAGILLLGGDSEKIETRPLRGVITTVPLDDPASFQVSGEFRGKPLGRVTVIVQRRFAQAPEPAGAAAPVSGFVLVITPDGTMSLTFRGTLKVARSGAETLRARGTAGNGTRDYLGIDGPFTITGGRTDANALTARYRVTGELRY